mmetsp:Transcript_34095/g.73543  ORF Transcript_34095/g.73543 Transcript_34095/m.73543 type:complete len:301 (-) Transcript_34095:101-1003(-)
MESIAIRNYFKMPQCGRDGARVKRPFPGVKAHIEGLQGHIPKHAFARQLVEAHPSCLRVGPALFELGIESGWLLPPLPLGNAESGVETEEEVTKDQNDAQEEEPQRRRAIRRWQDVFDVSGDCLSERHRRGWRVRRVVEREGCLGEECAKSGRCSHCGLGGGEVAGGSGCGHHDVFHLAHDIGCEGNGGARGDAETDHGRSKESTKHRGADVVRHEERDRGVGASDLREEAKELEEVGESRGDPSQPLLGKYKRTAGDLSEDDRLWSVAETVAVDDEEGAEISVLPHFLAVEVHSVRWQL